MGANRQTSCTSPEAPLSITCRCRSAGSPPVVHPNSSKSRSSCSKSGSRDAVEKLRSREEVEMLLSRDNDNFSPVSVSSSSSANVDSSGSGDTDFFRRGLEEGPSCVDSVEAVLTLETLKVVLAFLNGNIFLVSNGESELIYRRRFSTICAAVGLLAASQVRHL